MAKRDVMKIDWKTKTLVINSEYLDDYQINYDKNQIVVNFKYQNKIMTFVLVLDDQSYLLSAEFAKEYWKIDCDFMEQNDPDWIKNWEKTLDLKLD